MSSSGRDDRRRARGLRRRPRRAAAGRRPEQDRPAARAAGVRRSRTSGSSRSSGSRARPEPGSRSSGGASSRSCPRAGAGGRRRAGATRLPRLPAAARRPAGTGSSAPTAASASSATPPGGEELERALRAAGARKGDAGRDRRRGARARSDRASSAARSTHRTSGTSSSPRGAREHRAGRGSSCWSSRNPGHKEVVDAAAEPGSSSRAPRSRTPRSSSTRTRAPSTPCGAARVGRLGLPDRRRRVRDFLVVDEPDEVLERARLAVATRPGYPRERLDAVLARLGAPSACCSSRSSRVPVSSTRAARARRRRRADRRARPARGRATDRRAHGLYVRGRGYTGQTRRGSDAPDSLNRPAGSPPSPRRSWRRTSSSWTCGRSARTPTTSSSARARTRARRRRSATRCTRSLKREAA